MLFLAADLPSVSSLVSGYGPYGFGLACVVVVVFVMLHFFKATMLAVKEINREAREQRERDIETAVTGVMNSVHDPIKQITSELRLIAELNRVTATTLERTVSRLERSNETSRPSE
ncbi:MAG: hypothetical protein ACK4Y5_20690 [Acetobacteraceae bacterium]|jgi:hypothetical protein